MGLMYKKILYKNCNFLVENNIEYDKIGANSTFYYWFNYKIFTIYTIFILHQNNVIKYK